MLVGSVQLQINIGYVRKERIKFLKIVQRVDSDCELRQALCALFLFEFVLWICIITSPKLSLSSYGTLGLQISYNWVICDILNSKCLHMYKTSQNIEPEHFRNLHYSFIHSFIRLSTHAFIHWIIAENPLFRRLCSRYWWSWSEQRKTQIPTRMKLMWVRMFLNKQLEEAFFLYINNIVLIYM